MNLPFPQIEKNLAQAISSARVANAYLFLGPEGVGKFEFALRFAQALNCERANFPPCESCAVCKQIKARAHPDLHLLELNPDEKQIKIEEVRNFQAELSYRAFQAQYKIGIIRKAEKLTLQAMNALLKTLEEPLPNTVLILTCSNRSRLAPTIVSRCQTIRFAPIEKKALVEILVQEQKIPEEKARGIANYAEGSLERIKDSLVLIEQRKKFLEQWLKLRAENPGAGFELIENKIFSKNLQLWLEFLINWYRDLVRFKFNAQPEFNPEFEQELKSEAEKLSTGQVLFGLDLLLSLEEESVSFNLNPQTIGEQIFLNLR